MNDKVETEDESTYLLAGRGSTVRPTYVQRNPTVYGVFEHEMDNLTTWNLISSIFFSFGSACLAFCLTLFLESSVSTTQTDVFKAIYAIGMPAGIGLSIVFYLLGILFWWKRGGTLRRIKTESEPIR